MARRLAEVDAALADASLYARDPAQAQQLSIERGRHSKALAAAEESWLAASEAYEAAVAASDRDADVHGN